MRLLWVTNIPLSEANIMLGEELPVSGGWMESLSKYLSKQSNIELSIAFPKKGIKEIDKFIGEKITYYIFKPININDEKEINYNFGFEKIINDVSPDIVHIHGTEFPHTSAMVNICNNRRIKTIISIQGLVSKIANHIEANLPFRVVHGSTIRNILLRDNIYQLKKTYISRGKYEINSIREVKNIIGRTTWDKTSVYEMNPNINYYFCNEILREEFYKYKWDFEKCEKNTIFLSQSNYSLKGLHYVLEALPYVIKKFPNTVIYVSGKNVTKSDSFKEKFLLTYYGRYIKSLVKKFKIEKNVVFTGALNVEEMCKRYINSHVFVCPSSIENSPNSLGEAMILGVPSVASYVGGIPDMLRDKEEGFLYQHDAPYMLAHYICVIFENQDLALKFSKNARERALKTHDRDENTRRLIEIYNEILSK